MPRGGGSHYAGRRAAATGSGFGRHFDNARGHGQYNRAFDKGFRNYYNRPWLANNYYYPPYRYYDYPYPYYDGYYDDYYPVPKCYNNGVRVPCPRRYYY